MQILLRHEQREQFELTLCDKLVPIQLQEIIRNLLKNNPSNPGDTLTIHLTCLGVEKWFNYLELNNIQVKYEYPELYTN